MKKCTVLALILALAISLTGCLGDGSVKNPDSLPDGTPWNDSWETIGGRIGIDQPGEPFHRFDSNGDLPGMEMYYASWVCGEVTNIDEDTSAYDGQIYFMAEACGDPATAADTMDLWRDQVADNFTVTGERTFTARGVEFTLLSYDCGPGEHFQRGITALGVWKDLGLLVEVAAVPGLELDLEGTLERFLEGFHYAE